MKTFFAFEFSLTQFTFALDAYSGRIFACNIRDDKDYNIKYLPKEKVIVMRNCDTSGNLLDLKLSKSRFIIADPWAMLCIKTFRDCGQDIQVPICKTCNNHMDNLAADQSIENLKSMLCNHAKIASNIIRNFDNPVNLRDDDSNDLKVEIIHKNFTEMVAALV